MPADPYADLDPAIKKAVQETDEPLPRTKESLLQEAYQNKVAAANTTDEEEKKQFLANEKICLKAAEKAPAEA